MRRGQDAAKPVESVFILYRVDEVVEAFLETRIAEVDQASGAPAPTFAVMSASAITDKQSVTATYPQIQYTQNVSLNFATLTWPHVSVATLVPHDPVAVETFVVEPGDTLSGIAERFRRQPGGPGSGEPADHQLPI